MCLKLFNMAAPYSIFRPNLFKNKVAIVTGGGTGIGKGITEELLHLGCKVVVASRNEERLRKAAEDMRNRLVVAQPHTGADLLAIPCNIRKENEVKNLMESTLEKFHKIDFLVNNGGGQYISHVEDISTKGWQAVIDTNLTGAFLMCREAFHSGMKENGGSIVNIIADMVKGMLFMGHSGAARAGVENMTKTMAIEWAKYGIRINCVLPGSAIYSESAAMNYGDPALFERLKPEIPARRLGTVQEVCVHM
ncbi:PREDICTED: peroxisomal trans-2-enoyl-CoA reductase-like isoform X2 [Priapulus caudatus]|uniref:Peroxisomal trans-2-enoyl-CoA reductase n=1 Tax=Priapulus caudatus TaxID=37621 RepID=A0ABM1EBU5_PRICU|nr:PREDICTED: peroxisomal trans-2-enoyl-CoA reductase-like isoform X2 [Priapulus caudatus]